MSVVKTSSETWQERVEDETRHDLSTAVDSNSLGWWLGEGYEEQGEEEEEPVVVVAAVVVGVSAYREDIQSDRQSVELQYKFSFLWQITCQHREVG